VPTRRLHADKLIGPDPEDGGVPVSSGGLEEVRDENARLNLEVGTLISENQAARKQAGAASAAAERIRMFAHQAGEVVAKAELFDEKVGIGSKPSGIRIALILTDYSEKLERVLEDMREVVDHVTSLQR
jgi:hypothetical protein